MSSLHRIPTLAYRIVVALSILLTIAISTLWIRSYIVGDGILRQALIQNKDFDYRREWAAVSTSGNLLFHYSHQEFDTRITRDAPKPTTDPSWRYARAKTNDQRYPGTGPSWIAHLGLRWTFTNQDINRPNGRHILNDEAWVQIEDALLFIASLPITILAFYLYRRRTLPIRRAKQGLCPICGYDLRHTPDRCPECGTTIPARQPAPAVVEPRPS